MDGKRQRNLALLRALSSRYEIDYLILNNLEDFGLAQKENSSNKIQFKFLSTSVIWKERFLHRLGLIYIPSKFLRDEVEKLCKEQEYQFVFCRYIHPMMHLPSSIPIVVDIDDDLKENFKTRISAADSWLKKIRLVQVFWLNLGIYNRLLNQISLGFIVKPEQGKTNFKLLPNLPFQLLQQGPITFLPTIKPRILFVGKLTYPPNLSGIKWFIRAVFPLVLNDFPQVVLTIVSNLAVADDELEELLEKYPSIQVRINVSDLVEVYLCHSIAIAPIFEGAGSNIKIAESLLMGRPVVSTSFGTRGFEMAKGSSFLLESSTEEEFKIEIMALLKQPEKLMQVQSNAYQFAQKEFNMSRWTAQLLNNVDHVG